uniref:G protein-coupled receptor n=1 Tax=Pristionchus pacificus TaxID=54126 RepID=A0A8R1YUV6_PRIPA
MDLADDYPIIPIFLVFLNTFSSFPVILLIVLALKTQIHNNCRFLIIGWAIGFLGLFCCNIGVSMINFQQTNGYLTESMFEPVERNIACQIIVALSFFCSTFEVIIALERIVSSIEPHVYHVRGSSPAILAFITINVFLLSAYVGYFSHGLRYIKLGGVILSIVDFSTIVINLFAVRFCKGRFEKMFDKATLNARYQVKEAYEMAQAMRPVYFYSLIGMNSILNYIYSSNSHSSCVLMGIIYIVLFDPHFSSNSYGYIEAIYLSTITINAACMSVVLIKKHERFRKHANKIFGRFGGRDEQISSISYPRLNESELHFEQLDTYWK